MTRRLVALTAAVAAIVGLLALGVWQVERRAWKHALVAQVERRLATAPVAAPGPARWGAIGRDDAYTRVRVTGRFAGADTRVQAVTDLGGGYWVMTPFRTDAGWVVLVNRGFVPGDGSAPFPRRAEGRGEGQVPRSEADLGATSAPLPNLSPERRGLEEVTGLLRLSEPDGGFLRNNDPRADRWYSRDTAAIAARRGMGTVAPYFIDADRRGSGWPRGGMTVVRFSDNHLVYALTWFALAGLVAFLLFRATRRSAA